MPSYGPNENVFVTTQAIFINKIIYLNMTKTRLKIAINCRKKVQLSPMCLTSRFSNNLKKLSIFRLKTSIPSNFGVAIFHYYISA